jgi:O-antigen/teichoic acid export membrane protein
MITSSLQKLWQHFKDDNLFRNSIYLMLTTGLMGILGFFFWIIATHLFTPDQIGVGTTLISAMTLISFVSLLGFNSTFVRFLPNSDNRDNEINTGSILVMSAAALIAAVYVVLIPYITPKLALVHENIWYALGFVIMVALASINSLTDSIFIAYRSAQYNLITDGVITSGSKLFLPLVFVGLGAYGVFAASGLAASIGMVGSILVLVFKFGYRPRLHIDMETLRKVFHYSFTNYIANLLNIAPTLILPIIVINHLGAAAAGYYYLAFMIINLLYTVSTSVAQSLFAEGSYGEHLLRNLIKRSTIILVALMLPAAALLALFGPWVLAFFGKSYIAGGSSVIVILALSAPAVAAYSLASVVLRIRHQMYSLVSINFVYTAVITILTFVWISKGLTWVALAWATGNVIATVLACVCIYIYRGDPTPSVS